jgi:tRNA pseudouridine38-40 synthase
VWRRYAYRICDDVAGADPLVRRHVLPWPRRLDDIAMNAAAVGLLGEHDFAAFCKRRPGATTVRALHELTWARDGSGLAVASVRADAFCHHMVRALVGCLVVVGDGRRPPLWAAEVLRGGVRDAAVTVVRPHGLTLEEVCYPPDAELAAQAVAARRVRSLDG